MLGENVAKMQKGNVDRISELPEFILHTILSMLDTKEAGRASVLSKRWFDAWSSIPVLDFNPQYFWRYDDRAERFVGFIDKTMERYFTRKYRITKMYLMLLRVNEKVEPLIDKWIMIAVENQIQRLEIQICGGKEYRLPEILFCAKSLKYLECRGVILPNYETMQLVSLEYLILVLKTVVDDMLQRIISSCPLVVLDIVIHDECLTKMSLPWARRVIGGTESSGNGTLQQSNLEEYPLQKFVCSGRTSELPWPWSMNVGALRNLRELEFDSVGIRDDVISELSYGLVQLESLVISKCDLLKCINISSNSLKQLEITNNSKLVKATIDAPKLVEFLCKCEVETSLSVIQALDHCNAQFVSSTRFSITTVWLVTLHKFLFETNFFRSVTIPCLCSFDSDEIVVEEEQLGNVGTGVPYKLSELKLDICERSSETSKSSLLAFLNGLFWCCQPNVLSIITSLQDAAVKKLILSILHKKAKHCTDLLKSIEVESIEFPCVSMTAIRLRLSW